jgi:hypothetical protein
MEEKTGKAAVRKSVILKTRSFRVGSYTFFPP